MWMEPFRRSDEEDRPSERKNRLLLGAGMTLLVLTPLLVLATMGHSQWRWITVLTSCLGLIMWTSGRDSTK